MRILTLSSSIAQICIFLDELIEFRKQLASAELSDEFLINSRKRLISYISGIGEALNKCIHIDETVFPRKHELLVPCVELRNRVVHTYPEYDTKMIYTYLKYRFDPLKTFLENVMDSNLPLKSQVEDMMKLYKEKQLHTLTQDRKMVTNLFQTNVAEDTEVSILDKENERLRQSKRAHARGRGIH